MMEHAPIWHDVLSAAAVRTIHPVGFEDDYPARHHALPYNARFPAAPFLARRAAWGRFVFFNPRRAARRRVLEGMSAAATRCEQHALMQPLAGRTAAVAAVTPHDRSLPNTSGGGSSDGDGSGDGSGVDGVAGSKIQC